MTGRIRCFAAALAAGLLASGAARAEDVVGEDAWAWTTDAGRAAVDAAGNVYVVGGGLVVSKLDAAGALLWKVAVGTSENVAVVRADAAGVSIGYGVGSAAGGFTDHFGAIRLDGLTGAVLWVNERLPEAGYDAFLGGRGRGVVDDAGNVYVAGSHRGSGDSDDFVVVKFDASGTGSWRTAYSRTYYDWLNAVAVDPAGDVYVTGDTWTWGGTESVLDPDCTTVKLDGATGAIAWATTYAGSPDRRRHSDRCAALGFDGAGGVYVAGSQDVGPDSPAYPIRSLLLRLDAATGAIAWVLPGVAPAASHDAWSGLVTDAAGAAYVTGSYQGGDCATAKFLPDGSLAWWATYDGPEGGQDYCSSLALDPLGGLYVAGSSQFARGTDLAVLRYDAASGALRWRAWAGSEIQDRPLVSSAAIAGVGPAGELVVTGSTTEYFPIPGTEMFGNLPLLVRYSAGAPPAPLVAPIPVARLVSVQDPAAVWLVDVTLTASRPDARCAIDEPGTGRTLAVAPGAGGWFLHAPSNGGYTTVRCTLLDGSPAGTPVAVELDFSARLGTNHTRFRLSLDASAAGQWLYFGTDALQGLHFSKNAAVYTLDGSASRDPDAGPIRSWTWAVLDAGGRTLATLPGRAVAYDFGRSGTYRVALTVTDDDGRSATTEQAVIVP